MPKHPHHDAAVKLLGQHLRRIRSDVDDLVRYPAGSDLIGMGDELRAMRASIDAATDLWGALSAEHRSWREIGDVIGMSRQGAQQRFGGVLRDRPLPMR